MRNYALAIAAAAIAFPTAVLSQAVEAGPGQFNAHFLRHGRSVAQMDCKNLRKFCLSTGALRDPGQDNCRRYRQTCGLE
jgi:hypothetical protein